MKFLKPNLDLIITGLVMVLAVVAALWWYSSSTGDLVGKATSRLTRRDQAAQQIFTKNKPINIPGYGPIPGPSDKFDAVTYSPNLTEAKKQAQEEIKRQAEAIMATAAKWNRKGRIVVKGDRSNEHIVPLLSGKEEDHFLPTISATVNAWAFKADYEKQFTDWSVRLRFGAKPDPAALELNAKPVAQEIQERLAAEAANQAKVMAAGGGVAAGGGAPVAQLPQADKIRITKAVISNRAASLRCYVDEAAFQKRSWYGGAVPPTDMDIFSGLVDSWLINDVVGAIGVVNEGEFAAQKLQESQKNVGMAPIKRVVSITAGGSDGLGSGLFLNMGAAAGPGVIPGATKLTADMDYARSLTGHIGNSEYDVMWMNLKLVMDPAYVNQFVDALYRQNNGYTVLNVKLSPVDPLEAASNGYLYGDTQCVQVEMRVENIMFRSWTVPLMPASLRSILSVEPIAAPGR